MKIGIIGAGNLARSLIGGMLNSNIQRSSIFATNRNAIKRAALVKEFGLEIFENNRMIAQTCDTIILGVKPQDIQSVCRDISSIVKKKQPLLISLAAGVRVNDMERWLDYNASIVRTASNTPALIGKGATALFANKFTTEKSKENAGDLLKSIGKTAWVKSEAELDAITALVSSGPAYHFLFMELLAKGAITLGIDPEIALSMSIQTAYGASAMATQPNVNLSELRRAVTTPNGVTHQAITKFIEGDFEKLCAEAMLAAQKKCIQIGDTLSVDAPQQPFLVSTGKNSLESSSVSKKDEDNEEKKEVRKPRM